MDISEQSVKDRNDMLLGIEQEWVVQPVELDHAPNASRHRLGGVKAKH